MRLFSTIFILSTILPIAAQATPVKYQYSGTITEAITRVFVPGDPAPVIITDDQFGSSAVTNAIPVGTTFSGSFSYESDTSAYPFSFFTSGITSFGASEFAIGLANVSLDLLGGPATINYLGHRLGDSCPSVLSSTILSINGQENPVTHKFVDSISLGAGWPYLGGFTCADFDVSGLATGAFAATGLGFHFGEVADENPDLIVDNTLLPDDLLQFSNNSPEKIFIIYFKKFDDTGENVVDSEMEVTLRGTLSIKKVADIPEPLPITLLGLGLLSLGIARTRRKLCAP